MNAREFERMSAELDKVKYMCNCGHRVIIPIWAEKALCSWCGYYVFKEKKDEFQYRIKEKIGDKNGKKI